MYCCACFSTWIWPFKMSVRDILILSLFHRDAISKFFVMWRSHGIAWLCPPMYLRSIFILLLHCVWAWGKLSDVSGKLFTCPISKQREWLRTTLILCASLSCSYVMAAEKDASKAIQSVVATLPNIQKLKPEQEQSLIPTGFVWFSS